MKISLVLIDDAGRRFEGTVVLAPTGGPAAERREPPGASAGSSSVPNFSYDLNPRAFMKRYGQGMRGDQKFALLMARLVKGALLVEVRFEEVKSEWNTMTSVMGGKFNPAYSNRAKENGWVDTLKRGVYVLCPSWVEALENTNGDEAQR